MKKEHHKFSTENIPGLKELTKEDLENIHSGELDTDQAKCNFSDKEEYPCPDRDQNENVIF